MRGDSVTRAVSLLLLLAERPEQHDQRHADDHDTMIDSGRPSRQ